MLGEAAEDAAADVISGKSLSCGAPKSFWHRPVSSEAGQETPVGITLYRLAVTMTKVTVGPPPNEKCSDRWQTANHNMVSAGNRFRRLCVDAVAVGTRTGMRAGLFCCAFSLLAAPPAASPTVVLVVRAGGEMC